MFGKFLPEATYTALLNVLKEPHYIKISDISLKANYSSGCVSIFGNIMKNYYESNIL